MSLPRTWPRCSAVKQKSGELSGKSFRGSHANFRPGVRVDGAIGFASEHRANHVADGENFRAFLARFAFGGKSVRGFTRLADGDDQAVLVDDGVAVAILAAVVHFHWDVREPLDHELARESRVPTGAAGDNFHIAQDS